MLRHVAAALGAAAALSLAAAEGGVAAGDRAAPAAAAAAALGVDDECRAGDGGDACGLNALQLRGVQAASQAGAAEGAAAGGRLAGSAPPPPLDDADPDAYDEGEDYSSGDEEEEVDEESPDSGDQTVPAAVPAAVAGLAGRCQQYKAGCGWTKKWSCPGQARGSVGVAKDEGSLGYQCCCVLPEKTPAQMNTLAGQCQQYKAGCGWTKKWSCPGQPRGSVGVAKDEGSLGYQCCCILGDAGNTTVAAKKKKPKKTYVDAFGQCGGDRYTGPSKCAKGFICMHMSEYYAQCNPASEKNWKVYKASSPDLKQKSDAPLLTFYMYRVQGTSNYPIQNVNAGTLGGIMWYLHNEIVSCVYKDCSQVRRFGISRITRWKFQTRATQPLYDQGMNFGIRYAFDSGQCTGPWVCDDQFSKYGYFVGCNNLSSGFPFPTWEVYYSGAWFSLPGSCPQKTYPQQSLDCKADQPGGRCQGAPTGMYNCTYSYEPAGEISIDELEGIDDYKEFMDEGGEEYNPADDAGVNMTFWDGINDTAANAERVAKADALFKQKYPSEPSDAQLPAPTCDFDRAKFFPNGDPKEENPNIKEVERIRKGK